MKKLTFLPLSEGDKKQWFEAFAANLSDVANALSLDPAEVQDMAADTRAATNNIDQVYQTDSAADAAIRKRNEHREGYFSRLSDFVYRVKAHKNYTKALGELINIETTFTSKPTKVTSSANKLTAEISSNPQKVSFKLKRPAQHLIHIYSKRGNETEFQLLATITGLLYEDTRPNLGTMPAERREYVFTLSKNDKESARTSVYAVAVLM